MARIQITGGNTDSISNDWVGLDPAEDSSGDGTFGVKLSGGTYSDTLTDNVISAINGPGVLVTGSTTKDNQLVGNLIGTSPDGSGSVANQGDGVQITGGANYNTVGGTAAGQGNVISGNVRNGVEISGAGATYNVVEGNIIGLDPSGQSSEIPNGMNGVEIDGGATYNTIGGTSVAARNIISGNSADGVMITDSGTSYNVLNDDYIGTTKNGLSAYDVYGNRVGNVLDGVVVQNAANYNTIGGSVSYSGNLASGNQLNGIGLNDVSYTSIEDNSIGTDCNGATGLGVQQFGIIVRSSSAYNTIGGTTSIDRNLISGNTSSGVVIGNSTGASDPGTKNNLVEGNYIGTTGSGTHAIGNGWDGVIIEDGATLNKVGGTTSGARNVISGNAANGISINDATDNLVEGDYIGTDESGENSMANLGNGVVLDNVANHNTIGGTSTAARNVISGNAENGVEMINSGTNDNLVEGDYIGTDAAGLNAVGNDQDGVYIDGSATGNTIGGTASGAGNTIAWNGGYGIVFVNNNNTRSGTTSTATTTAASATDPASRSLRGLIPRSIDIQAVDREPSRSTALLFCAARSGSGSLLATTSMSWRRIDRLERFPLGLRTARHAYHLY